MLALQNAKRVGFVLVLIACFASVRDILWPKQSTIAPPATRQQVISSPTRMEARHHAKSSAPQRSLRERDPRHKHPDFQGWLRHSYYKLMSYVFPKKKAGARTTKRLTKGELKARAIFFEGGLGAATLLVVIAAIAGHVYKTRRCELPVPRFNGCKCLPFRIESVDVLAKFRNPLDRDYERLSSDEGKPLQAASGVEAAEAKVDIGNGKDSDVERRQEAAKAAWQRQQEAQAATIAKARLARKCICLALLAMYVGTCTLVPHYNATHTSCQSGFYWEDHLAFESLFFLTKITEVGLYTFDPSIEGRLPLWKFFLLFIPSFLGYTDGYQDSTSIYIADACATDSSALVSHSIASALSTSMFWTFTVGVVIFQWIGLGILGATCDPSLAILAKLIHMDALSLCISVPPEMLWAMQLVNWVRTIGEDLPQAGQQLLFVIFVKENLFMIVSIIVSVLCSMKAVWDAISRAAEALGLDASMQAALEKENIEESKACMIGLDETGKTTILYRLKLGKYVTTIPTLGFNVDEVEYKGMKLVIWEVGGKDEIRPSWNQYSQNIQVLIFVVDSSDRDRIQEASDALGNHLSRQDGDPALLVYANKQDLGNAMTVAEITEKLGLHNYTTTQWHIQSACATTGDGLYEGLDWISRILRGRI